MQTWASREMGAGLIGTTDAPTGETAFWDWPEWPKLMGAVIRDLLVAVP